MNYALYLSAKVFSTKVLIEDRHFVWSLSEPQEGLTVCRTKAIHSFLSYFKTQSIGPSPAIEPPTFYSPAKRSTD